MNPLIGLLILTGILYGLFIDGTFWKLYAAVVCVYFVIVMMQRNSRENGKRKTILISTWGCKYQTFIYFLPVLTTSFCQF